MLYLDVSYSDKDEAKSLGAKWDAIKKKWYVDRVECYYKFAKWLRGNVIIHDSFYLVEAVTTCWKCKKPTRVIAWGVEEYLFLSDEMTSWSNDGEIHLGDGLDGLPRALENYIVHKYNVKKRYSGTVGASYMSNGCDKCDILQGDWFLYHEPDSPFFIDSPEAVKKLKFYKIKLENDIALPINIWWGSADNLIKENGQFGEIIPLSMD